MNFEVNSHVDSILCCFIVFAFILVCAFLFIGEPDMHDALIEFVRSKAR